MDMVDRIYRKTRRKLVKEWIKFLKEKDKKHYIILDLGAGDCYLSNYISQVGLNVVATDVDKERLTRESKQYRLNVKKVVADGIKLPFKNDSFDGVICVEVIEHVDNPIALLEEVSRVLKPGGYFLLTTPNGTRPIRKILKAFGINLLMSPLHLTEFASTEILAMINRANFKVIKVTGYALDILTPILKLFPSFLLSHLLGPIDIVRLSKFIVVIAKKK